MSFQLARGAIGGGIVAAGLLLAGAALAGDNNGASVFQNGSGNSLFTDQSQASNSLIGLGTNPFGGSGALSQFGIGNTASITVSGGVLAPLSDAQGNAFLQQGSASNQGSGNSATIAIIGPSIGSVTQNGNGNTANLTAKNGAQGAIEQDGNTNVAGLTVIGAGTQVLYKQVGNGLTTGVNGITITSSSLAGLPTLPGGATPAAGGMPAITITQY